VTVNEQIEFKWAPSAEGFPGRQHETKSRLNGLAKRRGVFATSLGELDCLIGEKDDERGLKNWRLNRCGASCLAQLYWLAARAKAIPRRQQGVNKVKLKPGKWRVLAVGEQRFFFDSLVI